jgi:integrase
MAYNFILIMTNTGMRPSEARNLRWRDVGTQTDRQGRQFVRLDVRGKGKFRTLVAASNVATYLDRIRDISKHTAPDDFVFVTDQGQMARKIRAEATIMGYADSFAMIGVVLLVAVLAVAMLRKGAAAGEAAH